MLWEENLNHKKKKMKNEDSDKIDTIKNIKIESIKEIWIIIGGRKMWIRKCPQCDNAISHTTRNQKRLSEKRKRLCRKCYFKNKHNNSVELHDDCIRLCPQCNKSIKHSNYWNKIKFQKKNKVCRKCHFKNFETIPFKGHPHSKETKNKIRIALLNRIKKIRSGQVFHNPIACQYFDKLNKEKGWNLKHAMNGGEHDFIGYSVDAYDIKKNIVVEYDEPFHYHYGGVLKQKDIIRMNNIIKYLKCKFYRYDEKRQILKEYNHDKN